jgi:hypothetical protein
LRSCSSAGATAQARSTDRDAAAGRRHLFHHRRIQTIVAGALRGLNDTRVPLLLASSATG